MAGAKKSPRARQLHLLRCVESAFCRAPFFHDRDGLLVRPPDGQSRKSTGKAPMAGSERLHESEHAWVL